MKDVPVAKFRLKLLGRFELSGPDGPVDLHSKKLAALLAYLACTAPEPQSREKLATLLWGSHFEAQARQNLRQALFRLRQALGQDALIGDGEEMSLAPGVVDCDAARFEALIGEGSPASLAAAAELYELPLLAEINIAEEAWTDWLGAERPRLEGLALDAMTRHAEQALQSGDAASALKAANRAIAVNALREDAHRLVMRALGASGRRADALKHYEHLVGLLKRDLDVDPDAATQALAVGLRGPQPADASDSIRTRSPTAARPPTPDRRSMLSAPLGRQEKTDSLLRCPDQAGTEPVERRLAAILAADVAGYSRLMGLDEEGTLRALTDYRAIIDAVIARHHGRIFTTAGDSVLAEFASVVDAAECAIDTQRAVEEENARRPPDRAMRLRIGVNVGEVLARSGNLFGDAVNIATRLQAIAEPGAICLSGAMRDHLGSRLDVTLTDLGERYVKNIARPIRVFLIGRVEAPRAVAPLALPDRPSIAVLPFSNMSGDPEQEYFADGITEDIITALSRIRRFFVIARNSSFTYKGRAVDIKVVGRELGVRYVLEGSVRKAGSRMRITGQLIDAMTGAHLWADRFDGALDDVFELQDRVTTNVVGAIEPRVQQAELERSRLKPTEKLDAYDYYLRALSHIHRQTGADNLEALRLLAEASALDPGFALADALAAYCHAQRLYQGWRDPEGDRDAGMRLALRALERSGDDADVLWRAAFCISHFGGDVEQSRLIVERALALNGNSAHCVGHSGWIQLYVGAYRTGIERFERAMRLSPVDPILHIFTCGLMAAHFFLEDFETAVRWGREALPHNPNFVTTHRFLASSYVELGRIDEARTLIRQALVVNPTLRLLHTVQGPFRHTPKLALYTDALRAAGLPE
jgi:TolB-like protein/class 3 adenylate cyclase/DNA-binding SARP family transcriptional activator